MAENRIKVVQSTAELIYAILALRLIHNRRNANLFTPDNQPSMSPDRIQVLPDIPAKK